MKQLTIISMVSLFIVGILILPGLQRDRPVGSNDQENVDKSELVLPELEQGPEPVDEQSSNNESPESVNELDIQLVSTEQGFELKPSEEGYVSIIETASTSKYVVHGTIRSEEGSDGQTSRQIFEVIVMQPNSNDVTIFTLCEILEPYRMNSFFTVIDESNIMFVRPAIESDVISYDLMRLNIETGDISVISSNIWEVKIEEYGVINDFWTGSHFEPGAAEASGKLMLTTFKGLVLLIDIASGEVLSSKEDMYPAYGDLGSTPPRELVYPSLDLQRLVYQTPKENQIYLPNKFRLHDAASHELIKEINMDEKLQLMFPGIVWNNESDMFLLEYARKETEGVVGGMFDNAHYIFAEGIRFFNRDGNAIRDLVVPASSGQRMNAFSWAGDGKLWVEYYSPNGSYGDWLKGDISYKLYDIRSNKLETYSKTSSTSKLDDPVIIKRQNRLNHFSPPFLLVDQNKKLVWEPPIGAQAVFSEGELYMQLYSEDAAHIQHWDSKSNSWVWIVSESGNIYDNHRFFQVPVVYQNQWLVYPRDKVSRVDYIRMSKDIVRTAAGLPVLPGPFAEDRLDDQWGGKRETEQDGRDQAAIRVKGKSRYGSIQLQAETGELALTSLGEHYYYGTYQVVMIDQSGQKKIVTSLSDLALLQEEPLSSMTSYEFDGYDVLLLQPNSYRFSKGFDGNVKKIAAFAITKQGEAFPLTFQYADAAGMIRTPSITINDQAAIHRANDQLIVQSVIGEKRYELALKPDAEDQTLTVVDMVDKTAEYEQLQQIVVRYANLLEQALGLEDIALPNGKMDEEKLRGLFTDRAWNNAGFQYLKKDFVKNKEAGTPSRAFAWSPIDAKWAGPDEIKLTFTLNLWYAIGLAAHLEATMKLVDGVWMFHDFGMLETEKSKGKLFLFKNDVS